MALAEKLNWMQGDNNEMMIFRDICLNFRSNEEKFKIHKITK